MPDTRTTDQTGLVLDYFDVATDRLRREARQDAREAKRLAVAGIWIGILGVVLAVVFWLVPSPLRLWEDDDRTKAAGRVERAGETWLGRDLGEDADDWVDLTDDGDGRKIYGILAAPESVAVDPAETSPDDFIEGLQYVMKGEARGADMPGWRYWRNQLDKAMQAADDDNPAVRLDVGRRFIAAAIAAE